MLPACRPLPSSYQLDPQRADRLIADSDSTLAPAAMPWRSPVTSQP